MEKFIEELVEKYGRKQVYEAVLRLPETLNGRNAVVELTPGYTVVKGDETVTLTVPPGDAIITNPTMVPPAPPVTTAPPAPPTTTVPPAPPVTGVDLDSDGMPWAVEVCSSGKTKYATGNNKGRWIKKKNVSWTDYEKYYLALRNGTPPEIPAGANTPEFDPTVGFTDLMLEFSKRGMTKDTIDAFCKEHVGIILADLFPTNTNLIPVIMEKIRGIA